MSRVTANYGSRQYIHLIMFHVKLFSLCRVRAIVSDDDKFSFYFCPNKNGMFHVKHSVRVLKRGKLQCRILPQKLCLVGVLPREVNVRPAEVTIGSRLPVDGAAEIQHSNDAVGA